MVERVNPMASGLPGKPLGNERLEAKFLGNVVPLLGEAAARDLLARLWRIEAAVSAAVWAAP